VVEGVVGLRSGVRGLEEGVCGVVVPVDEVQGGDGAGKEGPAPRE